MMREPSVLDYVKSRLTPWKGEPLHLPPPLDDLTEAENGNEQPPAAAPYALETTGTVTTTGATVYPAAAVDTTRTLLSALPWRSLFALLLALLGQSAFLQSQPARSTGTILLALAAVWAIWAYVRGEWQPAGPVAGQETGETGVEPAPEPAAEPWFYRIQALPFGVLIAAVAFFVTGTRFSVISLGLMALSLYFLFQACWKPADTSLGSHIRQLGAWLGRPTWQVTISRPALVTVGAILLVAFFRFYRLADVPAEMVSDHAEKYLDVMSVLKGDWQIFFKRNGGREALQFYLLAGLHNWGGLALNYLTLKISTALVGFLALPFIYLTGKEIANRRVGLLAFTLAGLAYWGNVVSRTGMRLPFYMLFTAALMYFLVRAILRSSRNDFIIAGIVLGLGFYGYSSDRILPLLVLLAAGLYLLHRQSSGQRKQTLWQFAILALFAFIIFLPLGRYIMLDPMGFSARMAERLGGLGQELPAPAWQIFISNLRRSLQMFSVSGGIVWIASIPNHPALGMVSGGLFYLGVALAFTRWLHRWHWLDLFLLLSIPVLMLPSVMALAFPDENPSLYRSGGAIVPVFLLAALALDSLMRRLESNFPARLGRTLSAGLAAGLLLLSAAQNYQLVFDRYAGQARLSAWNYSEVGALIREFSDTFGSPETAWIMGYPYWLDTRLVAMEVDDAAYMVEHDLAMFVERLPETTADPRAKLFIVHPEDHVAIDALYKTYPNGWLTTHKSEVEGRDVNMFFVPPRE